MTVLVLVQGYALLVDPLLPFTQGALLAVVVGAATAAGAYVFEHRIAEWAARRAMRETESHGGDDKSKS
ncbi:hypothetical protein GS429_13555 [Natronorubrum sp. JWXQ-INN-674]|uniref:DUF7981 domain-containing protein n=1 Tax=Natronorubrum halalkaliphilum TaxID=2691917 RepID=A0A6B0VPY0_9EURY|nr:hypothetical protein [Natronorubrum halalkaliphilum]MXV63076.1 hypothetical protein [Natronorubrum halalkaliphilum]